MPLVWRFRGVPWSAVSASGQAVQCGAGRRPGCCLALLLVGWSICAHPSAT